MNIYNDNVLNSVKLIENFDFFDSRGSFSKIYNKDLKQILNFEISEVFYSSNKKNVIRGIHYQTGKNQLAKLVKCIDGEILDFFIDLREDSKTFGQYSSHILSRESNKTVYIPKGHGHGFSVLSEQATILYIQDGDYNSSSEYGISPLSVDFDWNVNNPVISEKDLKLPTYENFIKKS